MTVVTNGIKSDVDSYILPPIEKTEENLHYGNPSVKLLKAILEAKKEFDALYKDAANPFFKSSYVSLPNINKTVEPKLHENGVFISHCNEIINGKDYHVTRLFYVEDGTFLKTCFPTRIDTLKVQEIGSLYTYARRYNIVDLLNLSADEDDDGNVANGNKSTSTSKSTTSKKSTTKSATPTVDATELTLKKNAPRLVSWRTEKGWEIDRIVEEIVKLYPELVEKAADELEEYQESVPSMTEDRLVITLMLQDDKKLEKFFKTLQDVE
jgi:hypothetical protein